MFADTHGNVVWLGERDCSTQRRHQKLIEESPAPALDDSVRSAMGEAAVKVAAACGYVNAGTVECLYQDGEFWFLEMNTRLQVEHCVTEMVTSLDLVAEQLRVAAGEPLSFTQDDIERRGHSIEVRVNAEDPSTGFLPSPGTISRLRLPGGPGVRWDGGYAEGDTVSQHYDNLIGKLVVWGPDREAGPPSHAARAGRVRDRRRRHHHPCGCHAALAPRLRSGDALHEVGRGRARRVDLRERSLGRRRRPPPGEEAAELVEQTVTVEVNGKRFTTKLWLPDAPAAGASPRRRPAARPRPGAASGGGAGNGTITAPMQGTIVKVLVSEGDAVEAGQAVLVLEAMKMENTINTETEGTVREVRVSEGDTVGTGDVLIVIE